MNVIDVPGEERVVPAVNESIVDLCATASDMTSQAVTSMSSATAAPVGGNDDYAMSNLPVYAGSHGADD